MNLKSWRGKQSQINKLRSRVASLLASRYAGSANVVLSLRWTQEFQEKMPSEQSTWLISAPQDGDSEGVIQELATKIQQQTRSFPRRNIAEFAIPSFKVSEACPYSESSKSHQIYQTGTLDLLVSLSEDLPKQDAYFTSVVAKIVDTLRNLLNNDPQKLGQHTLVDERPVESYILEDWKWNEGRYSVQKSSKEIADVLSKVRESLLRCIGRLLIVCYLNPGSDIYRQCHESEIKQLQYSEGSTSTDSEKANVGSILPSGLWP